MRLKPIYLFLSLLVSASAHSVALCAAESVELNRTGYQVEVVIAGHPFTTYYFDPAVAKPYLQPLRSARGTVVTREFPIGNEVPSQNEHDPALEPHQRPIYFAHGDINGLNFWAEQAFQKYYGKGNDFRYGRTTFLELENVKSGRNSGEIRARFNLADPAGKPLAEEIQTYVFSGGPDRRVIDCQFVILANHGPVKIADTKEGIFAIRVTKALEPPLGHMVNSNGGEDEKQIWGRRADWVDYDGRVGGEEVGIAVFDSPRSFRHPTYWHARAYGLMAANPFGIREFTHDPSQDGSYTIPEGESVTFRYRVLIHEGNHEQAHVAEGYQQYATAEQVR